MSLLDRLFPPKTRSTNGRRIYAIGDVHGRYDLLVRLLRHIEQDQKGRPIVETHVVMLGDYIDRGSQSREVCELMQAMAPSPFFHCLRGNHEQVMLDVLDGGCIALHHWMNFGGAETLQSWGVSQKLIDTMQSDPTADVNVIEAFRSQVSPAIESWLRELPSYRLLGDYLFVHAGVRPKVALEKQSDSDLLWIREPFLSSKVRYPWCVIHGHSQSDQADVHHHRIGIDTGAYRTGVLTAIGIEEEEYWIIQTEPDVI